jgi:hypothetical protein
VAENEKEQISLLTVKIAGKLPVAAQLVVDKRRKACCVLQWLIQATAQVTGILKIKIKYPRNNRRIAGHSGA